MAYRDSGSAKCAETQTASATGYVALSESLFKPLIGWRSEGYFGQSSSVIPLLQTWRTPLPGVLLCCSVHQAHRGASLAVDWHIRHLKGHPGWCPPLFFSVLAFDGPACLTAQLSMLACPEREALVMALPLSVTQQYRLASKATWISSTGFSHHTLFLHIPLICLSVVISSPYPGIAPQFLNPSSQPVHLLGDLCPCPGCVYGKDCLILIQFRPPQVSCFTLSLKCFSSDSDNCPNMGIGLLLEFLHPSTRGMSSPTNTLLFHPTSFVLPSFFWVHIFLSTGQVLLSTLSWGPAGTSVSKVYS